MSGVAQVNYVGASIRFDWRDLELFVAVAEAGSIAKAAERCHTAASAASKRLSNLELALDAPLLERNSRGVVLTAAGQALLNRARLLIAQARQLDSEIRAYGQGLVGQVRLFANISAIVEFLPAALARFAAAYPQLKIHLEEHVSSRVAQAVRERQADLGIVSELPRQAGLTLVPFRRDQLVLVTPPDHPLAGAGRIAVHAAFDYPLIGLHANSSLHACLLRAAADVGRELLLRIQVTSFDAVCAMVAAGLGVGVVPRAATSPYVASLGLASVELSDAWAERQLYLCHRADETLAGAPRCLFEHLCQQGAEVPSSAATAASPKGSSSAG